MKIVIKISDEDYKAIAKGYLPYGAIAEAIRNCTPLPEHHGRLIDADDVNNHIIGFVNLNSCPTIIEAEGSDSD